MNNLDELEKQRRQQMDQKMRADAQNAQKQQNMAQKQTLTQSANSSASRQNLVQSPNNTATRQNLSQPANTFATNRTHGASPLGTNGQSGVVPMSNEKMEQMDARMAQQAQANQAADDGARVEDTDWVNEYDQFSAESASSSTPATQNASAPASNTNAGANTATPTQSLADNPQWQSELDGIMNKILNREKFEYDMNSDAMYQQYADIYQNQANLASQNAMAQNAALTGGYGSSYGQMVGQQAYAQQMQGLNDMGLDLYDRAYQQYQNEGSQLSDQYAMLAAREGELYGRDYQEGRDTVADSQFDKTLAHQTSEREATQSWQSGENVADRTHQSTLQNDSQDWQSGEAALDRSHQASENAADRAHQSSESALDRAHDSSESALDRTHQSSENAANREHQSSESALDRAHQSTLQDDAQAFQDEMSDEEFERMYGELEYDENGNIIAGGFHTRENEATREHDKTMQDDQQSFASSESALDRAHNASENALDRTHQTSENALSREHDTSENALDRAHQSSENAAAREHDSSENALDRAHQSSENQANRDWQDTNREDEQTFQSEMSDEEFERMYGEDGFYTQENAADRAHQSSENALNREHDSSQAALDRSHQASENALSREHDSSENALDRAHQTSENAANREHDVTMQDDAQAHQSSENQANRDWQEEMSDEDFERMYGEDGFYTQQANQEQANWQAEFDREGEWYDEAKEASNPNTTYNDPNSNLNGQSVPKQIAGTPGLTTTNTNLFNDNGTFKQAAVVRGNEDGTMTYNVGGEEISVRAGTSPYTGRENPDAKNGVFDNGYQPDNVDGSKLTDTGREAQVNGQWVPVYTTPDGQEWIYDAANNEYFNPDNEEKEERTPLSESQSGYGKYGGSGGGGGGKLAWDQK